MIGKSVQQYQVLEKLGAGGMGDIYKAQDTRLSRIVAIKVLGGALVESPDRHRRFLREARAASSLNHPNIITIHDILTDSGTEFMVMEYVDGRTLVELVPQGGLRTSQVLKLGVQMTDALQAAHAAGIVHRDLKPGNVMVTASGLVKVLDFGLAKRTIADPSSSSGEVSDQTMTLADAPLTMEGSIIGTVSYMAPEQALGKPVDARSDIFSLGLVFYEMVTGVRAFRGDSEVATLTAIIRDEARPIVELSPDVPIGLQEVIWRCLRKDPDQRFQSMAAVQTALTALKRDSDSGLLYRTSDHLPAASGSPLSRGSMTGQAAGTAPAPLFSQPGSTMPAPPPSANRAVSGSGAPPSAGLTVPKLLILAAIAGMLIIGVIVVVAVVADYGSGAVPEAVANAETLNNDSIIAMINADVPLDVIVSQIRSTPGTFNLSASELIRLTQEGVPGMLIETMRNPQAIPAGPQGPPPDAAAVEGDPGPGAGANAGAKGPEAKGFPKGPPPKAKAPPAARPGPPATAKAQNKAGVPPAPVPENVVPATGDAQSEVAVVAPAPEPAPATVVAPPAPQAPAAPTGRSVAVRNGQPFEIQLAADIPQDAQQGQALRFTVSADLVVEGSVVVRAGTPVLGVITQAGGGGFLRRGRMMLRLTSTTGVDGQPIPVRGLPAQPSRGQAERPVETPADQPNNVAAAAGTRYIAYIDGNASVTVPAQ